jgi:hypothetical protein
MRRATTGSTAKVAFTAFHAHLGIGMIVAAQQCTPLIAFATSQLRLHFLYGLGQLIDTRDVFTKQCFVLLKREIRESLYELIDGHVWKAGLFAPGSAHHVGL